MFRRIPAAMAAMQDVGLDLSRLARELENPRFYAGFVLVLLLHVALIWFLASQLAPPRGFEGNTSEMQATLIPSALSSQPRLNAAPEPQLQATITNEVPQPDIEIQEAVRAGSGIGAISAASILPPRPDPAIRNASPALPAAFAKLGGEVEVLLTILVDADGSIGDTRVAKSCGVALLDQMAQSFAKANWRFRAATANGEAVSDWTTVMVKFAPGG